MNPWKFAVIATTIICAGTTTLTASPADATTTRPNVLFILADDLSYTDLSSYGSTFHETPVLDKLAADGIRFTQAYAACPVCSPSRAAIMSGKYPTRTGVTHYIHNPNAPAMVRRSESYPLVQAPFADRLAAEEVTLAEALKEAGYATFISGKWHLGQQDGAAKNQGFDDEFTVKKAQVPASDKLADATSSFIRDHHDQPFFAYLALHAVHTPIRAEQATIRKYEEKRARLGLTDRLTSDGGVNVRQGHAHPAYAAMVEEMDTAIGSVLSTLDDLSLTTSTIVIFTSDNGGLSTRPDWPASNTPLRFGKGFAYEGGIRVPLIVRWPGTIPAGAETTSIITGTDYYPTLLDLLQLPPRPAQHMDGKSFARVLTTPDSPAERGPVFWHFPHYGNQGGNPVSAIRDGDWKLIRLYETNSTELYNLATDLSEQHDLADREPEKTQALTTRLDQWLKDTGAKFPTKKE